MAISILDLMNASAKTAEEPIQTHSQGLAALSAIDSAPLSVADIFNTTISKSSPSPFANDKFAPAPTAVMDFPLPSATMTASELTTYHLAHLKHVVTNATASREVLAEIWRHLKANPDTKDQLLPDDLLQISIALGRITGARANSLINTKAKSTAKATAKSETAEVIANMFADITLD
jgi:hypothetical protein